MLGTAIRSLCFGLAAFTLSVSASASAPTKTLAVCGASAGTGYYVIDGAGRWTSDAQQGGRLTFLIGGDGKPNLIYLSEHDGAIDTLEDGGLVYLIRRDVPTGEFGMVIIYPEAGTAETYNILRLASGKRQVVWTQNKAHVGPGKRLSSAKVFTADCD